MLLCSPSLLAKVVYELRGNQSITVRLDNGQEVILREGALISIDPESPGWAYSLEVLRSDKDQAISAPRAAKLGKQTFNDYLHRQVLARREQTPQAPAASPSQQGERYTIAKEGDVQFASDEGTLYLNRGDSFEILPSLGNSWKQEVVITQSSDPKKIGTRAAIGKIFLNGLLDSSHVVSSGSSPALETSLRPRARPEAPVSSLRPRARPEVESQQEESLSLDANTLCPSAGRYKVERSFFFNTLPDTPKVDGPLNIGAGSIVEVMPSLDTIRCQFKLISSEGEDKSLEGQELLTYPSNFQGNNLSAFSGPQVDRAPKIEFTTGARFVLTSPESVDLYDTQSGRISAAVVGAPYDVIGEQRGQLIVRAENGRQYRVDKESLEEARDTSNLFFDSQGSFTASLEQLLNPLMPDALPPCPSVDNSPLMIDRDPIIWESCRERARVGSNGRSLPANNYYDQMISQIQNFGRTQAQQVLADSQGRQMSECIMNSLKRGGNNNARPNCQRSSSGQLQLAPIRRSVRKVNSAGRGYTSIEIINRVPKACASELTTTYLTDNFLKAMNCLKIDPQEIFPLINHESSFQPGAVSPTGALSVGQTVVTNYLEIHKNIQRAKLIINEGGNRLVQQRRFRDREVYRREYENKRAKAETRLTTILISQLEDQIKNPTANGCEGLKNLMDHPLSIPAGKNAIQHVIDTENRRLCPPDQPQEAFLMAGIDYLANKKYAQSLIDDWEAKLPNASRMGAAQKEEFVKVLARWMYNGGQAGLSTSFNFFMEELTAGRVSLRDDNLNPVIRSGQRQSLRARDLKNLSLDDFKKYMSVHIMQSYSGNERRKTEVAGYIQKMDRDLAAIEEKGISCAQ